MGLIKIDDKTIINIDYIIDVRKMAKYSSYSNEKVAEGGIKITFIKDGIERISDYETSFNQFSNLVFGKDA